MSFVDLSKGLNIGFTCSWVTLRRGSDARIKIFLCRLNFTQGPTIWRTGVIVCSGVVVPTHHSAAFCVLHTNCSLLWSSWKKKWINYYPDGWQYLKFVASFRNIWFHPERNLRSSRRLFADFSRLNRFIFKATSPISLLTQISLLYLNTTCPYVSHFDKCKFCVTSGFGRAVNETQMHFLSRLLA